MSSKFIFAKSPMKESNYPKKEALYQNNYEELEQFA